MKEDLKKGVDMTQEDFVFALKQKIAFDENGDLHFNAKEGTYFKNDVKVFTIEDQPLYVNPKWQKEESDHLHISE